MLQKKVKILLIDNSHFELKEIGDLLLHFDVDIFWVCSIEESYLKIQNNDISLIILNTQVLDKKDKGCLQQFKNIYGKKLVPSIVVLKYNNDGLNIIKEFKGYVFDCITLPVIPPIFINKFKLFLNSIYNTRTIERLKLELDEKVNEVDRLKTAFLSNISHEIRTPMNAIFGFTEMLLNDDLSNNEKSSFIEIIQENCNILLSLIDDIIDISRLEANEIREYKSICRINDLMTELYNNHVIKDCVNVELKLSLDNPNQELIIVVDSFRLNQILVILLDNAYKFIENGTISFGYSIVDDHKINFFVSDTGPGIPKEFHDSIFERFNFYSPSKEKLYSGAGLGLSICKHLVKLLKGEIWMESIMNVGSTFYFSIPLVKSIKDDYWNQNLRISNN